jgi:hypothetical protein
LRGAADATAGASRAMKMAISTARRIAS